MNVNRLGRLGFEPREDSVDEREPERTPAPAEEESSFTPAPAPAKTNAITTPNVANAVAGIAKGAEHFGLVSENLAQEVGAGAGVIAGIAKGGVGGYATAAVDAAKLGTELGAFGGESGTLGELAGSVGGYVAPVVSTITAIENYQSGRTGDDALAGAEAGASWGSVIPGVGTVIGGVIGGAVGAIASAFGPGAKDPETGSWDQFSAAYRQNPDVAKVVQNPFLIMAGLFDLRPHQIKGQIPFYSRYGRMGEGQFTVDLTKTINQAIADGVVKKTDSPQTIYDKAVAPWIASMGPWQDANKSEQQALILRMVDQYQQGQYHDWKSVGGDYSFGNTLQPFGTPPPPEPKESPRADRGWAGGARGTFKP